MKHRCPLYRAWQEWRNPKRRAVELLRVIDQAQAAFHAELQPVPPSGHDIAVVAQAWARHMTRAHEAMKPIEQKLRRRCGFRYPTEVFFT